MRTDERRVSRGQATIWRTMLGKGPKVPEDDGIVVEDGNDTSDDGITKGVRIGIERDVRNLVV